VAETTFTFRVDDELKEAFAKTAKEEDRTAAQLLRALMREAVEGKRAMREHDAWFRAEVEKALKEADDPNVRLIPHSRVKADLRRQRAKFAKRLRKSA
jgi:predicted transcriptional regulator